MKGPPPLTLITAMAVLAGLSATEADAQQRAVNSGARTHYPNHSNSSLTSAMPPACRNGCFSWERGSGFHGGFGGGVWVVEREVPVYVEVPVPAPAPAAIPGTLNRDVPELPPRKPYVIGASYASLPGGCMKMIEEGVSFYYCSGEWYRQVGEGRGATYRAVERKL